MLLFHLVYYGAALLRHQATEILGVRVNLWTMGITLMVSLVVLSRSFGGDGAPSSTVDDDDDDDGYDGGDDNAEEQAGSDSSKRAVLGTSGEDE